MIKNQQVKPQKDNRVGKASAFHRITYYFKNSTTPCYYRAFLFRTIYNNNVTKNKIDTTISIKPTCFTESLYFGRNTARRKGGINARAKRYC